MPKRCSVCAHPRAKAIDERLRLPEPPLLPSLADEHGLTRFALMRHRDHHLVEGVSTSGTADPVGVAAPARAGVIAGPASGVDRRVRAGKRTIKVDAKTAFLRAYGQTGNLSHSARSAGVSRDRVHIWLEHDEPFKLAFNQAEVEAVELLEAVARERATTGSKLVRRVYRNGALIEEVHEYRPSDAVLVKLLAALRPDRWGDKLAVTQTTIMKTLDQAAWDFV